MLSKYLLFSSLALFALLQTCAGSGKNKASATQQVFVVSGQLSLRTPHCGGVAPSKDSKSQLPKAFAGQDIVIKAANSNLPEAKTYPLKTDKEGRFSLSLPAGQYCLLKAYKNTDFQSFYAKYGQPYDRFYKAQAQDCFEQWWKSCDLSFEVKAADLSLSHTFQNRCFVSDNPCMDYTGPMPP